MSILSKFKRKGAKHEIKLSVKQNKSVHELIQRKEDAIAELRQVDLEIKNYMGAIVDEKGLAENSYKYDIEKGCLIQMESENKAMKVVPKEIESIKK